MNTTPEETAPDILALVKRYSRLLLKKRRIFIIVALIFMSPIVWGSFFLPNTYQADSIIVVESNVIKDLVKGLVITPSIEERLNFLQVEILSRSILTKLIEKLDLDIQDGEKADLEDVIIDLKKHITIRVGKNERFTVSATGKNPKLVRDIVNTLVNLYVEESKRSKKAESSDANVFLSEQLKYYKRKIEEAEENLTQFRREKIAYVTRTEGQLLTAIQDTTEKLEEIDITIKELEAKKNRLQKQLAGEDPMSVKTTSQPLIASTNPLKARLVELENKLNVLLTQYTEKHPDVVAVRQLIDETKKKLEAEGAPNTEQGIEQISEKSYETNPIYMQVKENLFTIESDLESLVARREFLEKKKIQWESYLKNIPQELKTLATLQRERDSYTGIYNQLVERLGRSEVSSQLEVEDRGTNFRVVEPAVLPTKPSGPPRVIIIVGGIGFGFAVAVGVILLLDFFNNSFKDVEALKSALNIEILAVIPQIITPKDKRKELFFDILVFIPSFFYLSTVIAALAIQAAYQFLGVKIGVSTIRNMIHL
jgi:polysaccharide chain length determinant protein (PEP-CTERM system associated)